MGKLLKIAGKSAACGGFLAFWVTGHVWKRESSFRRPVQDAGTAPASGRRACLGSSLSSAIRTMGHPWRVRRAGGQGREMPALAGFSQDRGGISAGKIPESVAGDPGGEGGSRTPSRGSGFPVRNVLGTVMFVILRG